MQNKLLIFIVLHISLMANDCPRWAPIALDDIFTIIPIHYNGTNTAPDEDCDGVSDRDERLHGTNPSNPDTDGDDVDDYNDDYPLDPHMSVDTTAPVITLKGKSTMSIYKYSTYTEPGAYALDDRDGEVTVSITGSVNTSVPATYRITYYVEDAKKNSSVKYRSVIVKPEVHTEVVVDSSSPTDTTGSRPSSIVQQFIRAFLANDRDRVSELVGANQQLLDILYHNANATAFLKRVYKNVIKIEGDHHTMGDTSVTITFIDNNHTHKGGFELMKSVDDKWIIRQIY